MSQVDILKCDYNNVVHCNAVISLLNSYIADPMGGGEQISEKEQSALIKELANHPAGFALLARDQQQYVGLATCFIGFSTFKIKKIINIHDIVVLPNFRGKGIGRKLLLEVEKIAREMNCAKVTLEVREDNINAQHLYKSVGFEAAEPPMLFWSRYL